MKYADISYIRGIPHFVSDVRLRIEINNKKPVDLLYLTDSLICLSHEYRLHLSKHNIAYNGESRLYVKEIKTGSIITELINLLPLAIVAYQNLDAIIGFVENIKSVYGYYTFLKGDKPDRDKPSLEALDSIIEPIAQDPNSQMTIGAINAQNVVINNFTITSPEANEAQNRLRKEIEQIETPELKTHTKVILTIHQADNGAPSSIDKGIIESVSTAPLHIIWPDEIKSPAIHGERNFFEISFLVDVEVHTVMGKPKAYKIIQLHKVIE